MRSAILSDIHGNLTALEAVLSRLADQDIDRYLCLGDIVGYGPKPNECCEIIRGLDGIILRGNHDVAAVQPGAERWFTPAATASILWTREQLTPANREFLLGLEPRREVDGAHLCHGALFDPEFYTTTVQDAAQSFERMTEPICFFGHTHYAEWFALKSPEALPTQHPMVDGGVLQVAPDRKYMLNPGSVGQPRDGNSMAAFAVWDADAATIAIHRIPYNIQATQDSMEMAGLPWNMSARLTMGV